MFTIFRVFRQKEQQERWKQIWSQKDCQSYEETVRDYRGSETGPLLT